MPTLSTRLAGWICLLATLSLAAEQTGADKTGLKLPAPVLPPYVVSATVMEVAGFVSTYVKPGPGSELQGFQVLPPRRTGERTTGWVQFRGEEEAAGIPGPAAPMAPAPLQISRVLRTSSGAVRAIDLQASVLLPRAKTALPPNVRPPAQEPDEQWETTTVNIAPNLTDPRQGEMWIVHRDDSAGGVQFAMRLRCTLKPEAFPRR